MQATFRIPGYDSFEMIASGGMAVVFKARKKSLKKTVAVKVLHPHLAADVRFVARFQQEAETAARIQHDNIVNVIDYGRAGDAYYIVMEYYDGLTIEEILKARPRMPLEIGLTIAQMVAYGLDAAHAKNLVHRDIKPANIIVTRQGGVKIADFGLARDVAKLVHVTRVGKVVGTPAYMSPEQTRGELVGKPSDIFSLGVVVYEMLTGRRPFEGGSVSEVIDRIQSFEPPRPASLNAEIDSSIDGLVAGMMAKPVAQRLSAMTDVAAGLDAVIQNSGVRVDRQALKRFCEDPAGYASEPAGSSAGDRLRSIFRRIAGGDVPAIEMDAGKWREITPETPAELDPARDYRVMLVAIDRNLESPESFALKLAMRLKAPVPRMRSLASRTPCVLVDRLPYKKACWLTSVVKELGGNARMEALAPAPKPAPAAASPHAMTVEVPAHNSAEGEKTSGRTRRVPTGVIVCPKCGWEEDAHAKFCSMCHHSFNRTARLDLAALQRAGFSDPNENPLVEADGENRARAPGRPRWKTRTAVVVALGVALLLVPVVIFLLNLGR